MRLWYVGDKIFTASERNYADAIINYLDPNFNFIQSRLYREHCIKSHNTYIKDIRIISNRRPCDIVIVDNCAASFINQLDNGIHISTFTGCTVDKELENLCSFLKAISKENDVRPIIKSTFCLSELYQQFLADFPY